ncbi:MAG TPA: DUF58 domain-containing protein [Actinomycetes bacterium]
MTDRPEPAEVPLVFAATARLRRLALVAALSVVGAVITAHGELLALAAIPLVLLAAHPRSGLPTRAGVAVRLDPVRCVEGDELVLELDVRVPGADRVDAQLVVPDHTSVTRAGRAAAGSGTTATWLLVPQRWGRQRIGPLRLQVVAAGGLYAAPVSLEVAEVIVFPAAAALARAVAPRELAAPLGEHPSRAVGSGVEFAGVRPYQPGDRRRDVDWRTSARHGGLFVRQYSAERAFDLVLVLDTSADAGETGGSSLDLTVRAATGLATTYLRAHDRVGLVTFGGPLRWLTPATGPRQLYRVSEAVMTVRPDEAERDAGAVRFGLADLPRSMLPGRAFVCVVTPRLDDRPLDAVRLLLDRGFAPLVVDVLTSEPSLPVPAWPRRRRRAPDDLALRTWRMQREALTGELASLGVPVVPWDGEGDLTGALLHAMRSLAPEVRT